MKKMEKQEYVLDKIECFELKDTFTCGQCFRWQENLDGSYTGIVRQNVINIKEEKNRYHIKSIGNENIKELVYQYFDLERDYLKLQKYLSKIDKNMETSIKYGKGIRLLNQDLWETIISFIISANNNIPRIQKIIQRLSRSIWKRNKI